MSDPDEHPSLEDSAESIAGSMESLEHSAESIAETQAEYMTPPDPLGFRPQRQIEVDGPRVWEHIIRDWRYPGAVGMLFICLAVLIFSVGSFTNANELRDLFRGQSSELLCRSRATTQVDSARFAVDKARSRHDILVGRVISALILDDNETIEALGPQLGEQAFEITSALDNYELAVIALEQALVACGGPLPAAPPPATIPD